MSIAQVAAEIRSIETAPSEQQPFQAAEAGEHLDWALANPEALVSISRRLLAVAETSGCQRILGASPMGERLAAAAVAIGGNGLKLFNASDPGDHVLIVDGLLVTGVQIAQAAQDAREGGASRVTAAVVLAARDVTALRQVADEIVVLEH